jgi:hypothetical protein
MIERLRGRCVAFREDRGVPFRGNGGEDDQFSEEASRPGGAAPAAKSVHLSVNLAARPTSAAAEGDIVASNTLLIGSCPKISYKDNRIDIVEELLKSTRSVEIATDRVVMDPYFMIEKVRDHIVVKYAGIFGIHMGRTFSGPRKGSYSSMRATMVENTSDREVQSGSCSMARPSQSMRSLPRGELARRGSQLSCPT